MTVLAPLFLCLALPGQAPGAGEMPVVAIAPGGRYFTVGQSTRFLTGSTPIAPDLEGFCAQFDLARADGEKVVRVHLDHGIRPSRAPAGQIDDEWLGRWEQVIDAAGERGLYFLPVFAVWAHWNDGSLGRFHRWEQNPYNRANGGPAERPSELFEDTECQRLFVEWLGKMTGRLQSRRNVLGWEIFSEFDMTSRQPDRAGIVAFSERAADAIRKSDPLGRPVTASLAGAHIWPELCRSSALDFVQIHPYPMKRLRYDLMANILGAVPQLEEYGKPIVVGECSLENAPSDDMMDNRPRAFVAYRQSVWASMTGGLALAGNFWYLSGYGNTPVKNKFPDVCRTANEFASRFDFANLKPLAVECPETLLGCAVGNERLALGYVRDNRCVAPDWPSDELAGASVAVAAPGGDADGGSFEAEFLSPSTLDSLGRATVTQGGGGIRVSLPTFREDVAFVLRRQ